MEPLPVYTDPIICSTSFKCSIKIFQRYNAYFLLLNVSLFLIPGYTLLLALYQHSITTIFNKRIPSTIRECIPSFIAHLQLLKPLEIIFRFLTCRFRVLPDIIVLGEVRCGTTSFCQILATALKQDDDDDDGENENCEGEKDENISKINRCQFFVDCHTPFCLWSHPELDHKETFYFVGHFLGLVAPKYYRMCFPMYITKWWNEMMSYSYYYVSNYFTFQMKKRRRQLQKKPLFITFDGCAQYMTSPTASHLIAQTYKDANQPPPILIACVRDPVQQTISWWNYENNAQEWGFGMGLKEFNTTLRSTSYPPKTIVEALKYTQSDFVKDAYDRAENLFQVRCDDDSLSGMKYIIPPWAMSWPGGQLSGIGRNGRFIQNIERYEKVFDKAFHHYSNNKNDTDANVDAENVIINYGSIISNDTDVQFGQDNQGLRYINILPLETLSDEKRLKQFMVNILKKVALRKLDQRDDFYNGIKNFEQSKKKVSIVHRNASSSNSKSKKFDDDTMNILEKYFATEKEGLGYI